MDEYNLIDNEIKEYIRGLSKERQYIEVYRYISNGYLSTMKELAEFFDLDEKTIRSYIKRLKMIWKVIISYDRKTKKYYVQSKGELGDLRVTSPLTLEQVQSIIVALANSNSILDSEINLIKDKLFKLLYKKEEEILRKLVEYDCWNIKTADIKNIEIFKTIREAIIENKIISVVINNETIALSPYGFDYQHNNYYLVAEKQSTASGDYSDSKFKYYNLSDFISAQKLDKKSFKNYRNAATQIARLRNATFYSFEGEEVTVRVKFNQKGLELLPLRRNIITVNKIEEKDECEIYDIISFGIDGIKGWLLGFGDGAEVLEPERLRNEMRKITSVIINKYEGET